MAQFFNFKGDYFGLNDNDIDKNTDLYGLNVYTKSEKKPEAFSIAKVILSPTFMLMLIAGVVSLFGANLLSGILILLFDFAYAAAEIYFGVTADEKLIELRSSTAVKFRVIRNGKLEMVEKEFIVPEDLLVVQEGERVPADAYIQEARDLTADESVFTGSNKPIAKFPGSLTKTELSQSFVYAGTLILTGIAICKVSASGVDTKYYQKIGEKTEKNTYYTEMERTVRAIIPIASAVAAVMALISLIVWSVLGNEIVDAALRGITLGLCFVPTGIAETIRYYYIKGASELVTKSAIVKSPVNIEQLNSVSVLCIEKQGAISKNHLEVRSIYTKSEELLYKIGLLACDPNVANEAERALIVKAGFYDENICDIYDENKFIEKIPESNEIMSGALWEVSGARLYCIKGTPEQILPLCKFKGDQLFNVQKKQQEYYSAGYNVMAIACADAQSRDCDATAGFAYTFIGFVAMSAPLRDSISSAVKTFGMAGVKLVMLTEDDTHVAEATARSIGLTGKITTGKEISSAVKYGNTLTFDADIYAKVKPEQKLYILDQLKKKGEVVAMTGTRTTDAESLELADVGITIAPYCSSSANEAADIIVNDDNLTTIATMISHARQIHRNIKRAVGTIFTGYVAMLVLTILNLFRDDSQLMLNPLLLAVFVLILIPLAALSFNGNKNDMGSEMPPSDYVAHRKINFSYLGNSSLIGVLCGAVAFASYMFMYSGAADFARSCGLLSFGICFALFGLMSNNYEKPLKSILTSGTRSLLNFGAFAVLPVVLIYIPVINTAFGLAPLDSLALFISIVTGIIPAIGYMIVRTFIRFK